MPIFRVKSVKIYTGQKKLHEYIRGVRDKYQVRSWIIGISNTKCLQWTGSRQTSSNVGSSPGVSALYGNDGDDNVEKTITKIMIVMISNY